jgi:hypothetical protein
MRHASISFSRYLGSGSGLAFLTSDVSQRQVSRYGDGFDFGGVEGEDVISGRGYSLSRLSLIARGRCCWARR